MIDFSVPQRMSASAFVIIFLKTLKRLAGVFIIMIIAKVFGSDVNILSGKGFLLAAALLGFLVAFSLLLAFISYYPKKFYIKDGNLIFTHGLIQRENTIIPLSRIHTLRTKQGIVYQILKLRGIAIDTLASKNEEIELILDESDWQSLLRLIEKEEKTEATPAAQSDLIFQADTIRFENKYLILDTLCQNHFRGFAILAGMLTVIFDKIREVNEHFIESITTYTTDYYNHLVVTPLLVVISLVCIYFIVVLLWLGKVFLHYFDTILSVDRSLLTFSYGLLSRASSRFSRDKVCTIWVKRNFMEKKSGFATIMLQQAQNATAQKEDDKLKLYGKDRSAFFLRWWLGEDYDATPYITTSRSGKGVMMHILFKALTVSIIASGILCWFSLYIWTMIPAIYLLLMLFKGICAMRRSRITLCQSYIVVHNGRFAEILNYVKYVDIEVVRLKKTPFTRLFHRVSLIISTPGSTFSIRSLPQQEATRIFDYLLIRTEKACRLKKEVPRNSARSASQPDSSCCQAPR